MESTDIRELVDKYQYSRIKPQLLLGIPHHPYDPRYQDLPLERFLGSGWQLIAHQHSGYACAQSYFLGRFLKPKSVDVLRAMEEIADRYLDSLLRERGDPALDELIAYRTLLRELLDVDCSQSYGFLAEGLYPIDIDTYSSKQVLNKLTDEKFPDDLTELVLKEPDELLFVPDFELCILGENCD